MARGPEETQRAVAPVGEPRRYHSPRRERQAQQTRAAILAEATELFCERGWAGTTVEEVARRSETALRTVYTGFGSKVGLLTAAIDAAIVGDDLPVPLAERPAYRALSTGRRADRVTAAAVLITDSQRAAPLLRALRQAALDNPELGEQWRGYETRRRDELRHGLGLVFDRDLTPADLDAVWALTSTEVYDKLTGERGWTQDQYRTWITHALPRIVG